METFENTRMEFPMRINKYLSQKGFATRRSADNLVEKGKVFVNGKKAVLGQKVSETDRVEIQQFEKQSFEYILYYKPHGVITHSPEHDEVDIVTHIQKTHGITGVFPIGRLDKASEGLMLLTNDGRVTERLLSPENGHTRTYEVTVDKAVTKHLLKHLEHGVVIEGYKTKPATAKVGHTENDLIIELTEGKKHQIRRMCAALGYQVLNLKRTRILNLELKRLRPGQVYRLKPKEIYTFLGLLGLK